MSQATSKRSSRRSKKNQQSRASAAEDRKEKEEFLAAQRSLKEAFKEAERVSATGKATGKTPKVNLDSKIRKIQSAWRRTFSNRNRNARLIQGFFQKTARKRKARFLKSVCEDSGVCISFGKESDKIKEFFNGFTPFQYVAPPIRRIGALSQNGFVNEIKYIKDGYVSHALLKSSRTETSDNLMYEYIVGQYINTKFKQFPCFLETYGLYSYKSEAAWGVLRQAEVATNEAPKVLELEPLPPSYIRGCQRSKYMSILIQHIKSAIPLDKLLHQATPGRDIFFRNEFLNVLFQVYTPLNILMNEYTHYDLHLDNVLLYPAPENHYFECHYITNNGVGTPPTIIRFKTQYIAKIIDYGRSFFYENANNNSRSVYDKLCATPECNPNCGEDFGFGIMNNRDFIRDYGIRIIQRNLSHDLRLLSDIKRKFSTDVAFIAIDNDLINLIKMVHYSHMYGTPEMRDSGHPNRINNVEDACNTITQKIQTQERVDLNDQFFAGKTKMGDLYVYCNEPTPMRYEPVKPPRGTPRGTPRSNAFTPPAAEVHL
jgi:hypothetical protein